MRKTIILSFIFTLFMVFGYAQTFQGKSINAIVDSLRNKVGQDEIDNIVNGIIKNPDLYNKIWKYLIANHSSKYKFLKDINVAFKTFQNSDSSLVSLGLSYDVNFDYVKSTYNKKNGNRDDISFGLTAKGNVAFKKETNPNNLLETNINFSYSKFFGGTLKTPDTAFFSQKNKIEDELANLKDIHSKEGLQLWEEFGKGLEFSNQYFYNISFIPVHLNRFINV